MPREAATCIHSRHCRHGLNMMNSNKELAFQMQQELVTSAGRRNVFLSVSNTKRDTGRVLGIKKDAHTSTAKNEEVNPSKGFSKNK